MARQRALEYDLGRAQDLIRKAGVSREARRAYGQRMRQWYERGTDSDVDARYNKLRAHLDRLASYLWAPDAARFGIHLPPAQRQEWLPAAQIARDEFRDLWATNGADLVVSMALDWALVYNSTFIKVLSDPSHGFVLAYGDPWDLGVTREDQGLEDQDVVAHWYTLSLPQFERWIYGMPGEDRLLAIAHEHASTPSGGTTQMPRLVVSGIQNVFPNTQVMASFPGDPLEPHQTLDAQVIEPVVELCDLWIRTHFDNDPLTEGGYEDWNVETVIGNAEAHLVTRQNPDIPRLRTGPGIVLPADLPFALMTPRPLPNYLWGRSELSGLIALQRWREDLMKKIGDGVSLSLDPANFYSGLPDWEEAGRALRTPGGAYGSPDPGAKMTPNKVEVSQEAFVLQAQIDAMFDDQSGIPKTGQGQQEPGMRAQNQLITAAGIGAGRVRAMALRNEATLARVATLGFHVLMRNDAQRYPLPGPQGQEGGFLLAQLPPGISLSVSAHSASPIFAEQTQAKALALLKAGAIDGVWLTELLDPPYREEIKVVAERLAKAKAEQAQQLIQLQAAKYSKSGRVK